MADSEGEPPVILIVDEDEDVSATLTDWFTDEPWRVLTASCGRDALVLCARQTIDLLVVDRDLPDMRGVKLFWHLRNQGHPVACVVLTGTTSAESAVELLNQGVCACFEKPLQDRGPLVRQIATALSSAVRGRHRPRRARPHEIPPPPIPSQPVTPIQRPRLSIVVATRAEEVREVVTTCLTGETVTVVDCRRALEVALLEPTDMVVLDAEVAVPVASTVRFVRGRAEGAAIVLIAADASAASDLPVDVVLHSLQDFSETTADVLRHLRNERLSQGS